LIFASVDSMSLREICDMRMATKAKVSRIAII
jgi:hypothetical protein